MTKGIIGLLLIMFTGAALAEPEPPAAGLLRVKGGRFLTLNTVIRANQIEA